VKHCCRHRRRRRVPFLPLAFLVLILGEAPCAPEVAITPDVVYGHDYGMALTFDVLKPKEANGAGLLFMVSGGWVSRWFPPAANSPLWRALVEKGFTLFVVRHGSSPKFVVPEVIGHVDRAVRYIRLHARDYGVDPARLGVYGMSAGGHLSLVVGTGGDDGDPAAKDPVLQGSSRVAAVVAWCPPTDLRGMTLRVDGQGKLVGKYKAFPALRFEEEKAADCSPLCHVSPDDPPTLLIHGDKDMLVPIRHSRRIHEAFEKHKVTSELMVARGSGHGFQGEHLKRGIEAMVAWFEKHLTRAK
jgi:acetyl esterase/lipase